MISSEFFHEPQNQAYLKIDVSCEACDKFSSHLTECQACQPWQWDSCIKKKSKHHMSWKVPRLPCKWRWRSPKSAPAAKNASHRLKTLTKYCAVLRLSHRKLRLTRHETCCDVTKCHACHTKRRCTTFETFKSDHFCSTLQRHGHSDLTRTLADGCRPVAQRLANTPSSPKPQSETGTLATHSGKMRFLNGLKWHVIISGLWKQTWWTHLQFHLGLL